MSLKVFMDLENHALYAIVLSVLAILWWTALWGLFDEISDTIEAKYGVTKRVQYVMILCFILLVVLIHPQILNRI